MAKNRRTATAPREPSYSAAASEFVRVAVEAITEGLRRSAAVADVGRSASPMAGGPSPWRDGKRQPGHTLH